MCMLGFNIVLGSFLFSFVFLHGNGDNKYKTKESKS